MWTCCAGDFSVNPESVAFQAGRVMLERMRELVEKKTDFTFETTLSAKSYVSFLKYCKSKGYNITLAFIWLDKPEIAKARVRLRVRKGGHNVEPKVIERRYYKGIENFGRYFVNLCDSWIVWNNSADTPKIVGYSDEEGEKVVDQEIMRKLKHDKKRSKKDPRKYYCRL